MACTLLARPPHSLFRRRCGTQACNTLFLLCWCPVRAWCSFAPSATDAAVVAALAGKTVDAAKFPNVARYVNHINHFAADVRSKYVTSIMG